MNEQYPLTLEHVKQFLATKQDNDPLGTCGSSMYCLLSETLNWLYPEKRTWRVDITDYSSPDIQRSFNLTQDLLRLRMAFDLYDSYRSSKNNPISKASFRAYLSEYWTSERDGELDLPFLPSTLFEDEKVLA